MGKICSNCLSNKDPKDFFKTKMNTKDGLFVLCKKCHIKRTQSYKSKNPEKFKEYRRKGHLAKRYGITVEWYNFQLKKQNNQCAICQSDRLDKTSRRLSIDHNHITGKVRGLLCSTCNRGLGNFKDSPIILLKAIRYLKNEGTKT